MEIWRDIPRYEGLYKVSSVGNVKSVKTGRLRKIQKDRNGYRNIRLYKDGRYYTEMVHRLVAEAFIPNPKNLPEINHIDEVKWNNRVNNLEWCTRIYNMNYGSVGEKVSLALSKPVIQLDLKNGVVNRWKGARIAARKLGVSPTGIIKCCNGERKTNHGCKWKYESEVI